MTKTNAASVAGTLGLAMALLAPLEVEAKSAGVGFGARSFHSVRPGFSHRPFSRLSHRPLAHRYRNFGQYPGFGGGVVGAPYFAPGLTGDVLRVNVVVPPEPPYALTCQHSRDTINVPSENGGTREITVARC